MKIRYKRNRPVIICDVCDEVVTEQQWELAIVKWDKPSDDVVVCHVPCDLKDGWNWNNLGFLLETLAKRIPTQQKGRKKAK